MCTGGDCRIMITRRHGAVQRLGTTQLRSGGLVMLPTTHHRDSLCWRRLFHSTAATKQPAAQQLAQEPGDLRWEETGQTSVYRATIPRPWLLQDVERQEEPASSDGAYLIRAHGLVTEEVMANSRRLLSQLEWDLDPDSVDGQPTFEIEWMNNGQYTHDGAEEVFKETVESRVVPMIRASCLMPPDSDLVLCQALMRSYRDGQRLVHPAHFDGHALVTVVFEIDTSEHTQDLPIARGFAGDGFYVQAGAHVSSRQPVQMRPGDVCAHSFDLQHGVDVSGGHRVSVILWFADSVESCEKKVQPWHRASAEAGNPDAQYNWGKTLVDQKWTQRGQSFMEAAAVQGHFMAQNDLGAMAYRGQGTETGKRDLCEAERWYGQSAAQGFQKSMVGMSMVRTAQGRPNEALEWLERAAEQRADPAVPFRLGKYLMEGTLSAKHVDVRRGRAWMSQAAGMGHSGAQASMALGVGEGGSGEGTAVWAKRAADQGNRDGASLLALQHLKQGNLVGLVRLGVMWLRRGSLLARIFNSSKAGSFGR